MALDEDLRVNSPQARPRPYRPAPYLTLTSVSLYCQTVYPLDNLLTFKKVFSDGYSVFFQKKPTRHLSSLRYYVNVSLDIITKDESKVHLKLY